MTNDETTTWWYQHQGHGQFTQVYSTVGTIRVAKEGHFKTVLEILHENGFVERRVMTETEEEYMPDNPDEWRVDVATPDIGRERALLILDACEEIDVLSRADDMGERPPSTGGAEWGPAHIEAMSTENERVAERVRARRIFSELFRRNTG